MTNNPVQPIILLKEGTNRTSKKDAQRENIAAACAVAEIVSSTLGPKGMDKMLVDSMGDITITNDGVTILKEMDVQHPIAQMLVNVAKTQDASCGDGTTSVVVLAGSLLKEAEILLEKGIHPNIISQGFQQARDKCFQFLDENSIVIKNDKENPTSANGIEIDENIKEIDILHGLVSTAITGKYAMNHKKTIGDLSLKAVEILDKNTQFSKDISIKDITTFKRKGGSVNDSCYIDGLIIEKERCSIEMPKKVSNARILLLSCALEVKKPESDAKISIQSPADLKLLIEQEEKSLQDIVQKIAKTGANVLFTTKGIDDNVAEMLATKGILCCKRLKNSDMKKLAKATTGRIFNNISFASEKILGHAGVVEEESYNEEKVIIVRQCPDPKSVSILLRGSSDELLDELERCVDDAVKILISYFQNKKVRLSSINDDHKT